MKMPIIRLTGIGLYSLSRLAVGDIKEIIVRWTGGGYFELDDTSHVIINGDGRAFTNNFSFLDQKYDLYYKEGVALVALLAGKGAKLQGAGEKFPPQAVPPLYERGYDQGQSIDFGPCPPNEQQLNSLAHVLAIMCLGFRLNVDSIKTLAEVSEPCTKDNINLAVYPCEMGTGGEVIRMRTQAVLDDMKKGLYRSINPALAERPIWVEKD